MLFRTRKVKKKYFKLKKKHRSHIFKKNLRNSLRNWHVFNTLKKIKHQKILPLFNDNKNFFFGKSNYIQKTFKEAVSLSSEYRLIFQNFIRNKLIFNNYENYYKEELNQHHSHFNACGPSTLVFSFFVVKFKVRDLVNIFNYFKNYCILNCTTNYCFLIYYINGNIQEFLLFYLLYLRYVFDHTNFEDIIFSDLNYKAFRSLLLERYLILNQFYFCMLKYTNTENSSLLSKNILNLEVFDERTSSEKSKDEIDDGKLFEDFELEESENMLLNDYILYNNSDYLNLLNDNLSDLSDLSDLSAGNLYPIIMSDNENYLKISLAILENIDVLFLDNLESLEN